MLSILIPVFQNDVRSLVSELYRQCISQAISFEIICIDDGSGESIKLLNREISRIDSEKIKYTELPENIGRSAIRNKLAIEAGYSLLWFLDCDSKADVNPRLLTNFLKYANSGALVSGGRLYAKTPPTAPELKLHWLWGSKRELLDPEIRMKNPVSNFLSNNFIIPRSVATEIGFNEALKGYGYEDTLFAAELEKRNIPIIHINNPVLHDGLEPANQFLKKIEESLDNLLKLRKICMEETIGFPVKGKLYSTFISLNKPVIKSAARLVASILLPVLRKKLSGSSPDLITFDLYRLSYLLVKSNAE